MKKAPFPYQLEAIEGFKDWFASDEREALIALTVGLGKTFTAGCCIEIAVNNGKKVLWLTHRDELIRQSAKEIEECTGIKPEIEQAEKKAGHTASVVVASVPTLRSKRLEKLAASWEPDLIICDEAHHALAKTWMAIKQTFKSAKILNLTATPYRTEIRNRLNLGRILIQKNTSDGINMGRLVPFHHVATIKASFKGVTVSLGDFEAAALSKMLRKKEVLEQCVDAVVRHIGKRKAIIFAADVNHGKEITQILRAKGLNVAEVYGETPPEERQKYFEGIRNGTINVLVNNLVLTEGFNLPEIDMVCLFRPTKNAALYLQMLGRGLRTKDGKKDCSIIDIVDLPKKTGVDNGFIIPDEQDQRKFASLCSHHYPKAIVFLSWFRKISEVNESGATPDFNYSKLNTAKKLYETLLSKPSHGWSQRQVLEINSLKVLYSREWNSDSDPEGFKLLQDVFSVAGLQEMALILRHHGWGYYPRLELKCAEESGVGGGKEEPEVIDLQTIIQDDPQLKNFIVDILENKACPEEQAKEYYSIMMLDGIKTVWQKVIYFKVGFHFISKEKSLLIVTRNGDLFHYSKDDGNVRPLDVFDALEIIPDYARTDRWASELMSEKQLPIVAKVLKKDENDIRKAKISRLSASCLISNHTNKKYLKDAAGWLQARGYLY